MLLQIDFAMPLKNESIKIKRQRTYHFKKSKDAALQRDKKKYFADDGLIN